MFTIDDLNPAVLNVQYAVRGELAIKAEEFREGLKDPKISSSLPFSKVVSSNIGNPQQKGLDQPPITFVRQACLLFFCCSRSTMIYAVRYYRSQH